MLCQTPKVSLPSIQTPKAGWVNKIHWSINVCILCTTSK